MGEKKFLAVPLACVSHHRATGTLIHVKCFGRIMPVEVGSTMREAEYLREQARQCVAAAREAQSRNDGRALMQLARYYERQADKLDTGTLKVMH